MYGWKIDRKSRRNNRFILYRKKDREQDIEEDIRKRYSQRKCVIERYKEIE